MVAYDHILANPQLGVKVVNSSFGVTGGGRFDSTDPINQATKRLHAAGITVVFSNGNSGTNASGTPPGASDCSDGRRERRLQDQPLLGRALGDERRRRAQGRGRPALGAAAVVLLRARRPRPAGRAQRRDDRLQPDPHRPGHQRALGARPDRDAQRRLTASNDPSAATPPPGKESLETYYTPLTGTSMAAPALTGAVAVMQSAAKARLGRFLTPAEVEGIVTRNADAMTPIDALYDFPCGTPGTECGTAPDGLGLTGQPLEKWQNGAGYLDIPGAVAEVEAIPRPPGAGDPAGGWTQLVRRPGRSAHRAALRAG